MFKSLSSSFLLRGNRVNAMVSCLGSLVVMTVKILEGIIRFYRGIDIPVLDLLRCLCLL